MENLDKNNRNRQRKMLERRRQESKSANAIRPYRSSSQNPNITNNFYDFYNNSNNNNSNNDLISTVSITGGTLGSGIFPVQGFAQWGLNDFISQGSLQNSQSSQVTFIENF